MEYLFNELSVANPATGKAQALAWMQTLLQTCKTANKLGFTHNAMKSPAFQNFSYPFFQTTQ
jgi:hypothetical protein